MNQLLKVTLLAGVAAAMLNSTDLMAQAGGGGGGGGGRAGRGNRANMDPAQMQQRMMDRYKEVLGVTDDSEWKVISTKIEAVMTARRELGGGGFGMMGRGGRGGRGGNNANQDANAATQQQRGNRPRPAVMPEREALQKALDDNAPTDEIKTKLAAYHAARKAKQAALQQAQADLRKLLSVKQEAAAYLNGLLSDSTL
jgi:hypothetical protein